MTHIIKGIQLKYFVIFIKVITQKNLKKYYIPLILKRLKLLHQNNNITSFYTKNLKPLQKNHSSYPLILKHLKLLHQNNITSFYTKNLKPLQKNILLSLCVEQEDATRNFETTDQCRNGQEYCISSRTQHINVHHCFICKSAIDRKTKLFMAQMSKQHIYLPNNR